MLSNGGTQITISQIYCFVLWSTKIIANVAAWTNPIMQGVKLNCKTFFDWSKSMQIIPESVKFNDFNYSSRSLTPRFIWPRRLCGGHFFRRLVSLSVKKSFRVQFRRNLEQGFKAAWKFSEKPIYGSLITRCRPNFLRSTHANHNLRLNQLLISTNNVPEKYAETSENIYRLQKIKIP